jgi:hypothetical protein
VSFFGGFIRGCARRIWSRPEEAGMVPSFVSKHVRYQQASIQQWWAQRSEKLLRQAIALDQKLGDIELAFHQWWGDCVAVWPPGERPIANRVIVEPAIDPRELERLEREQRFAAIMTKGRWR